MEFPKPTIDVEAEATELSQASSRPFGERAEARSRFRGLLAQAWEEGRWSPPGACMNPYGEPAARPHPEPEYPPLVAGNSLARLRAAAAAALAWIENMSPTVRRTALAEQLRAALGDR